jgi:hypothetical protein
MEAPRKPSLLDQLREQSEAKQLQEGARRKPIEETLQDIDRRLWRVFRWFDEAIRHLAVIKPTVSHVFRVDPVLAIASPRYESGFVSYRKRPIASMELLEHVEVFYKLAGADDIVFKLPTAAVRGVEDRLRAAGLEYHYQTESDPSHVVRHGVFRVKPEISASIRFEPDYRAQRVEVVLRNVDRFESVSLEFFPDALDEAVLEDLFRFIVGESNTFLRRAPLTGVGPAKAVTVDRKAAAAAATAFAPPTRTR